MANSFVRYTGNASTTAFAISFSYRAATDLTVTVSGTATTAFTLNAAGTTLTFNNAPANASAIEIRRKTSQTARLTDYADGSVLTENDLDTDSEQAFFMSQEAIDDASDVISLDNSDFQYNVGNKRLKNISNPTAAQDAVTKNYLENTFLTSANKTALTTVNANISNINAVNSNASNINAVAGDASDIGTVASNIGSVTTVASDISKVIAVANDLAEAVSEIETVADDLNEASSEIEVVGANIANVNTVGGISANVTSVANIAANVTSVAGVASNVTAVAGISGDVTAVANIASDVAQVENIKANVTTVAGISANVTSVAGISSAVSAVNSNSSNINAVNSNASNINTVAGNNSNISTVAGVSSDVTSVAGIASDVSAVENIASNVTTVAGMSTAINTVNSNSSNVNTVSGSIANVNLTGGSIANVNTVATNLASVNAFGETYRIASSAPSTSLNSGDLYFNTSTNVLNVYGASGWQNAGSSVNGTSERFKYVASGTPTTLTGNDANGNTLAYDAGFIDVYLNGIKMVNGTDVTVTSGSSIVFASALTNGDIIEAVTFGTFSVANMNASNLSSGTVPTARLSGAYTGITSLGTITSFRSTGIDDNSNALAITIDSSERVGIGTTAPDAQFQTNVASATIGGGRIYTNAVRTGVNSSSVFSVRADNASGSSNGDVVNIQGDGVGDLLVLSNNGTDRATFQADGKVGIGTASPAENLQIMDTVSNKPQIRLETSDGGNKRLDLYIDSGVGTIAADQSAQQLAFRTANSERMRILADGKVGIGTSSPQNKLHVTKNVLSGASYRSNAPLIIENSSDTEVQILSGNSGSGQLRFGDGAANFRGGLSYNHGDDSFILATGGANQVTIHSNGVVSAADGIALGVGLLNTASNVLDDYEEGTFTPSYSSGIGSGSLSVATGRYTKIGNKCTFEIQISGSNLSGDNNQLVLTGLPFSAIGASPYGGAFFNYNGGFRTDGNITWHKGPGNNRLEAYQWDGSAFKGNEASNINSTYHIDGFYTTA